MTGSTWRGAVAGTCGAGGVVWSAHALLLAGRPEGCIAATCAVRPHRPSEDVAWLLLVAVVLVTVGSASFAAGAPERGRRLLRWGAGLVAVGAVLLTVGIVVNATVTNPGSWWLHDSDTLGRFLPVLGGALTGWGLLRGRMLAPWVGMALLASAAVSLGFNAQDARVLLDVPMGLAWVLFGSAVGRTRPGDGTSTHVPGSRTDRQGPRRARGTSRR